MDSDLGMERESKVFEDMVNTLASDFIPDYCPVCGRLHSDELDFTQLRDFAYRFYEIGLNKAIEIGTDVLEGE